MIGKWVETKEKGLEEIKNLLQAQIDPGKDQKPGDLMHPHPKGEQHRPLPQEVPSPR